MITALSDFSKSIEELEVLLRHSVELEKSLSSEHLSIIAATSKSVVVLSCGYFENFLKAVFMEYIENLNKMNVPKKYLRPKIWETNMKKTIKVLDSFRKKEEKHYGSIVLAYATSFQNNNELNKPFLVKEAFSITYSNPKCEVIEQLFRDIGLPKLKENDIFTNTFPSYVYFENKLDGFVELRHSYAHGEKGIATSSLADVEDYIHFLKASAYVIHDILNNEISKIDCDHHADCFKFFNKILIS